MVLNLSEPRSSRKANVKFIAWVPGGEKEQLSAQAPRGIITYLPHPNHTRCLPNKLFDYMLMSLPMVASNFPLYQDREKQGQKLLQIYDTILPTEGGY